MENMTLEALKEKYADYIASLSDENKAKVEACKTVEELTTLVQNTEGELPDDIAEAIAGGKSGDEPKPCPHWDDYVLFRRSADAKDEKDGEIKVQYLEFVCRECWARIIKRKGANVVVVKNWFKCSELSYLDSHYNGYGGVH